MQTEMLNSPVDVQIPSIDHNADLYRTRWLMAHNRLHSAVHEPSASLPELWSAYLNELQSAEEIAQRPA